MRSENAFAGAAAATADGAIFFPVTWPDNSHMLHSLFAEVIRYFGLVILDWLRAQALDEIRCQVRTSSTKAIKHACDRTNGEFGQLGISFGG
ncbi:hypothetical protein EJB05_31582 [Eragrostis curvula]|uniref:Uncharacterized protein n=1 Tax=Eragrostis curvula TaxID=38414 RepID=A0A5J9UF86_9POAL|nr:hypothetical protein EJB05_31582 [Eragrostis curvula]